MKENAVPTISDERLAELIAGLSGPMYCNQTDCLHRLYWLEATFVVVADALRELALARSALAWQPIETAPKNGSRILLAANVHDPSGRLRISSGLYTDEPYWTPITGVIGAQEGFQCDGDDCIPSNQEAFTHWMPLPAPPALDEASAGEEP